jgi:dienelactone hydrolase
MRNTQASVALGLALAWIAGGGASSAAEKKITFQSDDGYQLHGDLHLPASATAEHPVAGILLLPSPNRERQVYGQYAIPGLAISLEQQNIAALRIDYRGVGESTGDLPFNAFTQDQRDLIVADVRKALDALASQPGVDPTRLGIISDGYASTPGVLASKGDPRVRSFVFLTGLLTDDAKKALASRPEVSVLTVFSKEDRDAFRDMTDVYLASPNKASNLWMFESMGNGTSMFLRYRETRPKERPLDQQIVDWLGGQLRALGYKKEVTFKTEDGFTIYGNLRIPDGGTGDRAFPGVVLLHSGLSDRNLLYGLEQDLARNDIAVLNIDWRGRGKSKGKGIYFSLSKTDQDNAFLDAKAAIDFLASQKGVDSDRIGVFGTVLGARWGSGGAVGDNRVKTMILVSTYDPGKAVEDYITSRTDMPVLVMASADEPAGETVAKLHKLSKNPDSQLKLWPGGGHGYYQIAMLHPDVHDVVVQWMKERLAAKPAKSGTR